MPNLTIYSLKEKTIKDYGYFLFLLGIFFLPSAMVIGILLLLPAFIISSLLYKESFFKDQWNLPFFLCWHSRIRFSADVQFPLK